MRLDRKSFEAWLKAKQPDDVVGENRDCHSCPLALFYAETSGGCEVVIFDDGYGGYLVDRGYSKRQAPWWAERFIFLVDGDIDNKITAGRALKIMSQIAA